MVEVKAPRSLRAGNVIHRAIDSADVNTAGKVAVAALAAVGTIGTAEAQSQLPPVNIDAPQARPKPPSTPSAEQKRVRAAVRRAARRQQQAAPATPAPGTNADTAGPADRNPYADAAAPYKADRLASPKFTEPLVNQPRTVTVLTKELLQDKNATTLKEVARSTAGVTLGTGEGGNAFGDRFFIRGFDARNDVFVDGVRDPAVSIRENFFTEQVEILRGPASSFAGRGTAGGAINIVTKQATDRNFYNVESTLGTDFTKRVTVDVNQVITPTLAVRMDGLFQNADVAGRKYVFDDRWGGLLAVKWTPTDFVKVNASYVHTDLNGLPDFGVPYNAAQRKPQTDINLPRDTWYGFVNRDFQKVQQDFGTLNTEIEVNPYVTLNNKTRVARSVLDYIGTLPSNPTDTTVRLASQSRYQVTDVVANQTDATFKFQTGPVKHALVVGAEVSQEKVWRDTYAGLTAELSGFQQGNSTIVSLFDPPNLQNFVNKPQLAGNPASINVDTKGVYAIETANYRDFIILNAGVRLDDYDIAGSSAAGSNGNHSDMFNYNVGLVVKPVPIGSLYAAYATSSNPIGAELDASSATYGGLTLNNNTFQALSPEENKAAEVGTKWELFDRRLLVTAALFQTEKTNAREVSGNNIIAGAAYRVRGIDIEAAGKITDRLSLYGGIVLMESKVLQSIDPTQIGAQLANIAHQSFNVLTKYKFTDPWEVGVQATYVSQIYGGTFGAVNGNVLPAHWRFDAFTEYKINKTLTAKLSVNNIFDTVYYDAFYRSNTPFVFIAPGRSAYLTLRAKF
jgi:catecholate siderophore receptor